jgi:DNA-binding FadR family transcriptional regulator
LLQYKFSGQFRPEALLLGYWARSCNAYLYDNLAQSEKNMNAGKLGQKASSAKSGDTNLHRKLAQSIGNQILSGVYAPGAILPNEADWCRIYGASRTTVREAVKTLTAKGLLKSRTKIGSRVEPRENWNILDRDVLSWHIAAMNPQEFFASVQEVRKILEPEIAALAALNRTPQQLRAITEALEDMRKAKMGRNSVEPDVRFHLALLAAANNALLTPFGIMIESALTHMFEYTSTHNPEPDMFIPKHEGILKAVTRGNAKAARKAALSLLTDTDQTIAQVPSKNRKAHKVKT